MIEGFPLLLLRFGKKSLEASFNLWYLCLGHVPFSIITPLNKLGYRTVSFLLLNPDICSSCQLAKSKKLVFNLNEKRVVAAVIYLIHCDFWGPTLITTSYGFKYYVVFVNDFSCFSWT